MPKPKVFVTRSIQKEIFKTISAIAETNMWPESRPIPHDLLVTSCQDVDGLFAQTSDQLDSTLLHSAPKLRVIAVVGTGIDNIDVTEATNRSIAVGNTPGVTSKSTADMAIGLLLTAARRIVESDRWLRSGNWEHDLAPVGFLGSEFHGSTLGIVGLGKIGLELAKRAKSFDMKIIYFSRTRKAAEEHDLGLDWTSNLDDLLSQSDFVSIHVPFTPETRHLISEKNLIKMKQTAILVNTSRGPVVDQTALYHALREGTISGAALDVMEVEPIDLRDPLITLDNVVLVPHLGTATHKTRLTMATMATENLFAGLKRQRLPHIVNPEVYSSWEL